MRYIAQHIVLDARVLQETRLDVAFVQLSTKAAQQWARQLPESLVTSPVVARVMGDVLRAPVATSRRQGVPVALGDEILIGEYEGPPATRAQLPAEGRVHWTLLILVQSVTQS